MAPLLGLVVITVLSRLAGWLKLDGGHFSTWPSALCAGVAALFLLAGGAHFVGLRADMIRMVPPVFGDPGFWVTFTGVAEIAGAIGILIPATRRAAAVGLLLLLVAVFPANAYAAQQQMIVGGQPATPLLERSIEQVIFFAAVAWAGFGRRGTRRSLGDGNTAG